MALPFMVMDNPDLVSQFLGEWLCIDWGIVGLFVKVLPQKMNDTIDLWIRILKYTLLSSGAVIMRKQR